MFPCGNPARREKALGLGADFAIDPVHDDTGAVLRAHGVENVDRVIDCAGLVATAEYAVEWAGRGAVVMLFGFTGPDDEMRLKPYAVFEKELSIRGSFVNPNTFSRSIALLASGRVRAEEIVSHVVPLKDIAGVFEQRLYAREGKVLIDCGGEEERQ